MIRNLILSAIVLAFLPSAIFASSEQAYKDYIFQFDTYRIRYNEFQVAKNEYEKFKTLTAQNTALEKTKSMMSQRDALLKAYLFALNEKLNEGTGLSTSDRDLYQTLIRNEVQFLDTHAALIPAIGSIADAQSVSRQLESHYLVLQKSVRQILIAITISDLTALGNTYNKTLGSAESLISTHRASYTNDKQSSMDRWVLQIKNKQTLFTQKIASVQSSNANIKGDSIDAVNRSFSAMQEELSEARQYLAEGTAYFKELTTAIRYTD